MDQITIYKLIYKFYTFNFVIIFKTFYFGFFFISTFERIFFTANVIEFENLIIGSSIKLSF